MKLFTSLHFLIFQESILQLSNQMHESLVRTSFLGAASASKGKRLDFSDRVWLTMHVLFSSNLILINFLFCFLICFSMLIMQLFFPICHEDHWFSFVVDFKWKLFAFLDSFYGPKSEYQCAVRGPLVCVLFLFLYTWSLVYMFLLIINSLFCLCFWHRLIISLFYGIRFLTLMFLISRVSQLWHLTCLARKMRKLSFLFFQSVTWVVLFVFSSVTWVYTFL
jgi:hypothetical protein